MSNPHNRSELRFLVIFILFIAVILWSLPSDERELSQTQCDELYALSEERYLKAFNFDASWDFEKRTCNTHETAILNALHFLAETPIRLPETETEFDFYAWAKRVDPVFKKRNILAFSGTASFADNSIDISTTKLNENDVVSIANIIVHELRHLEEGLNSHVPCARIANATCDMKLERNPFEGGAYNYNVAYLYRLIEFGDITRAQRFSARRLLELVIKDRFNFISAGQLKKYEAAL